MKAYLLVCFHYWLRAACLLKADLESEVLFVIQESVRLLEKTKKADSHCSSNSVLVLLSNVIISTRLLIQFCCAWVRCLKQNTVLQQTSRGSNQDLSLAYSTYLLEQEFGLRWNV